MLTEVTCCEIVQLLERMKDRVSVLVATFFDVDALSQSSVNCEFSLVVTAFITFQLPSHRRELPESAPTNAAPYGMRTARISRLVSEADPP